MSSVPHPGRRRLALASAAVLVGLLAGGCALDPRLAASDAADATPATPPATGPGEVAGALRLRLEQDGLSIRGIDCRDSNVPYGAASAFLCTVNFGDPHLVPYCAALDPAADSPGTLVTDRDDPAMTCYPPADAERYRENAFGYRND